LPLFLCEKKQTKLKKKDFTYQISLPKKKYLSLQTKQNKSVVKRTQKKKTSQYTLKKNKQNKNK